MNLLPAGDGVGHRCSVPTNKKNTLLLLFVMSLSLILHVQASMLLDTSRYEEGGPCLSTYFSHLSEQNRKQPTLRTKVKLAGDGIQNKETEQILSSLFEKPNEYILTYIKLTDGTILSESLLKQIASAFEYSEFDKNFIAQYGTKNRVFRVLVTPRVILSLRKAKLNIEWIRRVPASHRISVPIVDIMSFARTPLLIETAQSFSERRMFSWMNLEVQKRVRRVVKTMSENEIHEFASVRGISKRNINSQEWMKEELSKRFLFSLTQVMHPRNKLYSISPGDFSDLESIPSNNKRMINDMNVELAQSLYEKLASDESIIHVSRGTETQIFDVGVNTVVQGGRSSELSSYVWDNGVTGVDQIVSYIDTGISVEHCLFYDKNATNYTTINTGRRKIIGIEGADLIDNNGHGSHVAGIIAGDFTYKFPNDRLWDGVAKDAKLYVIDFSSNADGSVASNFDLFGMLNRAYNTAGSRIHSNSWGCKPGDYICDYDRICYRLKSNGERGTRVTDSQCMAEKGVKCHQSCLGYTSQAVLMDQFLYDHDDMIIVHATGNNGNSTLLESIAAPSTAKNLLSVGAVHNYYESYCNKTTMSNSKCEKMYYDFSTGAPLFSGKGPTLDGRNKPDVVAPGHFIMSAQSGTECSFIAMSGTSMATPAVSGSVALVRDYFTAKNNERLIYFSLDKNMAPNETVSGTLLKAFIIGSTLPVEGGVYSSYGASPIDISKYNSPNPVWGYGTVSLDTSMKFSNLESLRVVNRKSVSPGQSANYPLLFKSGNLVRITITWYDRAGQEDLTNSTSKLINDMDLKVTCSGGEEYLGNGIVDNLNTVEQVFFQTKSDVCYISVKASENNIGDQKFSMVISSTYEIKPYLTTEVISTGSSAFYSSLFVAFLVLILSFLL